MSVHESYRGTKIEMIKYIKYITLCHIITLLSSVILQVCFHFVNDNKKIIHHIRLQRVFRFGLVATIKRI